MSRYIERVEALENNEKKKKIIFTAIVVILVLLFMGGMVLGARSILTTEGTFDPYALTEPEVQSLTAEELHADLTAAVAAINDPDRVRVDVKTEPEIPDDSFSVSSGNEALLAELKYIKGGVLASVKEYYTEFKSEFGEDSSPWLHPVSFAPADLQAASCVRGRWNDEGKVADTDVLFYTYSFPSLSMEQAQDSPLYASFGMENTPALQSRFVQDIAEAATVEELTLECTEFSINAEKNRTTQRLSYIRYTRAYRVTLLLTFRGDLAALGTQRISFTLRVHENQWVTWAGLMLSDHTLFIEKRDIEAIEAFRTADEDVVVTWSSSDPTRVTVDERGYIKGKVCSAEPVIITATFDYLGNTYTDSCTVFVRKPVEKIKTTPRTLALQRGATQALTVEVLPKKATIQGVEWFTEDASVASVDADGKVTAVGSGTTKVYALSEDGHYRSSCTVTVE